MFSGVALGVRIPLTICEFHKISFIGASFVTVEKQECIPVGCVPPASVAATRCQYEGGSVWGGRCRSIRGGALI